MLSQHWANAEPTLKSNGNLRGLFEGARGPRNFPRVPRNPPECFRVQCFEIYGIFTVFGNTPTLPSNPTKKEMHRHQMFPGFYRISHEFPWTPNIATQSQTIPKCISSNVSGIVLEVPEFRERPTIAIRFPKISKTHQQTGACVVPGTPNIPVQSPSIKSMMQQLCFLDFAHTLRACQDSALVKFWGAKLSSAVGYRRRARPRPRVPVGSATIHRGT